MTDQTIKATLKEELLHWFAANPPGDGTLNAGSNIALSTARNAREENQDRAIYAQFSSDRLDRRFSLIAVLDGIGGMIDGGRCAELAIASLISNLIVLRRGQNNTIVAALTAANREVWEEYDGRGGATFAGIFFEKRRLTCINVGDSRVYRYAPSRGLVRESQDDLLGNQFAKIKGLEDVAINPELAGRLGQYVGMSGQTYPNVRSVERAFLDDRQNYFLVATDGATAQGDAAISSAFERGNDPKSIADLLIRRSAESRDADNATVVCAAATSIESVAMHGSLMSLERLRIWSSHGLFNFILPAEQIESIGVFLSHNKKDKLQEQPGSKRSDKAASVSSKQKHKKGKPKKPKLTIQELTFEDSDDETTA